jgi:hypothetical protein
MKKKSLLLTAVATLGLTAATMAQNIPSYVPTIGLVGWWPFNGNANDESGNGNNGTVNGATLTSDRFTNSNNAYSFDGISNSIEYNILNLPINNQARSFSCWFYVFDVSNSSTQQKVILNYGPISSNQRNCLMHWGTGVSFIAQANDACAGCSGSTAYYNPSTTVDSMWHNLIIAYQNDTIKGYLDGQLSFTAPKVFTTSLTPMKIGYGESSHWNGEPFYGKLDDIGIWDRALTQQEITALYNASNCSSNSAINPQINSLSTGSTATFNATTSDPNPSYVWQSNLGQGFQTLNDLENYSGTNTSSLSIANVQLSEHNQPIRVITTSGECVDTSDIATISILDTCVTSINDTTFITVTDTLVINTLITGINPPNNSNTIKVYPNPSNSHITIEYGDFAIMNGYQLRIENSLGQEVFQTSITQESDYLNLNSWGGNGLYFVHIVDPQGNTIDIRKIVLQ